MILTSFLINLVLFAIIVFLAGFLLQNRSSIGTTTQGVASNVQELQDGVVQLQEARIKTTIAPRPAVADQPDRSDRHDHHRHHDCASAASVQADIDLGPFGRLNPMST